MLQSLVKQRTVNSKLSQHKLVLISHPGLWFACVTYFCRRWARLPRTSSRVPEHSQFHVISCQAKTRIKDLPITVPHPPVMETTSHTVPRITWSPLIPQGIGELSPAAYCGPPQIFQTVRAHPPAAWPLISLPPPGAESKANAWLRSLPRATPTAGR